jgi:hypothetical protein
MPPGVPRRPRLQRALVLAVAAAGVAGGATLGLAEPSHTREWLPEQAVLPQVTLSDSLVHVRHVRSFDHDAVGGPAALWVDRTYDLRRIDRVWYVLSPFGGSWRGPAHSFLSFGFADSTFVTVSVEARREVGQAYSPFKGLLRRYELMYVIGEERDVIGLRAVTWNDPVHLYPMRATPEQARALFVAMMRRAQEIEHRPEFYNTLTNNCATSIRDPVNALGGVRIPFSTEVLLPGYSDALVHRLGLIDTDLSLEDARSRFLINDRARAAADASDFSLRIRDTTRAPRTAGG